MSFESSTPPPPEAPLSPSGPVAPGSGLPVTVAAGLASLFTLPGGLIFMFLDRRDPYVRYYAIQGIVLGSIAFLMGMIQWLMNTIFGNIPFVGRLFLGFFGFVLAIVWLIWMAAWVVATFCAFTGKQWRLPYLSSVLKKYSSRIP